MDAWILHQNVLKLPSVILAFVLGGGLVFELLRLVPAAWDLGMALLVSIGLVSDKSPMAKVVED